MIWKKRPKIKKLEMIYIYNTKKRKDGKGDNNKSLIKK
jgi:hypothetical protein